MRVFIISLDLTMKKINNNHLNIILNKSKKYRTIDVLIYLSDLTKQFRVGNMRSETLFIVPSHNSAYSLWEEVNRKHPNIINSTTFRECLNELKELNIVKYNSEYDGFELVDMNEMIKKRGCGYTEIRDFFFEDIFLNMNFSCKKMLIFLIHLLDKKQFSKKFKKIYKTDINLNLNNYKKSFSKEELNIMNILKTKNVYYVKEVLDNLLLNYPDLFTSKTQSLREENYGKVKGKAQGVCVDLTYFFDINNCVKENNYDPKVEYEKLSKKYTTLVEKINEISSNKNISMNYQVKISLLRKLYRYLPYVQNSIINTIVNRLYKIETIGEKPILNIDAFIQYLINTKFKNKTTLSYRLSFQRGWVDFDCSI